MGSRSHRLHSLVPLLPVLLLAVACGPGGASVTGSSSQAAASSPSLVATASPLDSGPPATGQTGQTDTEWGRIWDAVPSEFPRFPGWAAADDASAATASDRYGVSGGDPEEIAAWLQAGLETATFSTDVSGPLEDGTMTLDSVGDAGCRLQTTVTPLGGMTFVTVLYGAACPMP